MLRYPSITVTPFVEPFDGGAASLVRHEFRHHIKYGRRLHVIDLDQLDAASSAVFRSLIIALRTAREAGGDVKVVTSRPGMRRALALTGLARVFRVHASVRDAVIAFREQPRLAS